jgi:hypothetical protein
MLLAAAHKLGIGVVFDSLLISVYFNPIEPTLCDFFIGDNIFNTGITDSPTKIFSEVQLKEDAPSKFHEPHKKDFLYYVLIFVGTASTIGLVVIFAYEFPSKHD